MLAVVPFKLADKAKIRKSQRKQADRQKRDSDPAIAKLVTQEVMEFHQSKFAESWSLVRKNWGGKRENVGRRKTRPDS